MSVSDRKEQFYFDRVDEALDLISRYDPRALRTLQRRFAGILVFGDERFRLAHWRQGARLCILTARYVASSANKPEDVALTLIHESTHARLAALGIRYQEGRRGRIELICARAELSFSRRVPYTGDLVQRTESRIDAWAKADEERWSDRNKRAALLEYLRETGAPAWLVNALRKTSEFFSRRAA